MQLHLGIDGGGTHTRAILVDAMGRVQGEGMAGPSNYHNVGLSSAGRSLREAAEAAWASANLQFAIADTAFLGCAGIKASGDIVRLTVIAESVGLAPAGHVTVANDLHNALAGGLAGRPGIALIAGTGTNCLGCDASGKTFMCGGWGWLLDDIGGGIGIALAGLRSAARAADRRAPATNLLSAAMAFFGLTEANELLERLYARDCPPDELAAFAPVVIREAMAGDEAAWKVLTEGARALAELVAGTSRELSFPDGPDIVILGGCARSGAPYQPLIEGAIREAISNARIIDPIGTPTQGAAINALRAAGINPIPNLTSKS